MPTSRTSALVRYPTTPKVNIPITMVGYCTIVYEVLIRYPRPNWPETISAAARENQATPMEICSPVKMNGSAPGTITCRNTCQREAPRHLAARM